MPSFAKTVGAVVLGLAAVASAMPAQPKFTRNQMKIHEMLKRQNANAAAAGLTDVDILNFALTLEWLETTFYQQGFAKFPTSDFQAAGLTQTQITDLLGVGKSEEQHVVLLQGAIAQAGAKPVQPCSYNFNFTDAKGMLSTAAVLEQAGISAYLGASKLVSDPAILQTAATILSVEARHGTFTRITGGLAAAPNAFDTPLGPKNIFSLAAPFIQNCPEGSNLALTAFPPLTMAGAAPTAFVAGQTLSLNSGAPGGTSCAFTVGGATGGTIFTPFQNNACPLPEGLAGVVFLNIASQSPLTGVLTDEITISGPMPLIVS